MKVNTSDIVAALRHCSAPGGSRCEACAFVNDPWCGDVLFTEAANRLEEYVDRCARYAEEIAQLRSGLEPPTCQRVGGLTKDNVREKLVELLESINAYAEENLGFDKVCGGELIDFRGAEYIADHLLANGVTVQEYAYWTELERAGDKICAYCSNCSTGHEAPNYAALAIGHRHCRWCGARMLHQPPKGK